MTAADIIGYIQQLDFENRQLKAEVEELRSSRLDASKFYAVAVGVEHVATLHGVHADTVRKYAKLGLIPKHQNSADAKMLFRASDILLLDFSELRRIAKYPIRR